MIPLLRKERGDTKFPLQSLLWVAGIYLERNKRVEMKKTWCCLWVRAYFFWGVGYLLEVDTA
ncbi:MAG: hypothetical protein AMJ91_03790 [candidate division Zixibacteria bacterium SM23_73_3]|nr:MAG: hypothetical protein AMJ91_03790 [candidate division Zixibacteria bacterium SM23_73_3]